jgi:hypothetical protein
MILVRHQPERTAIFAWLKVVAVREAFRLCRAEQVRDTLSTSTPPTAGRR